MTLTPCNPAASHPISAHGSSQSSKKRNAEITVFIPTECDTSLCVLWVQRRLYNFPQSDAYCIHCRHARGWRRLAHYGHNSLWSNHFSIKHVVRLNFLFMMTISFAITYFLSRHLRCPFPLADWKTPGEEAGHVTPQRTSNTPVPLSIILVVI